MRAYQNFPHKLADSWISSKAYPVFHTNNKTATNVLILSSVLVFKNILFGGKNESVTD